MLSTGRFLLRSHPLSQIFYIEMSKRKRNPPLRKRTTSFEKIKKDVNRSICKYGYALKNCKWGRKTKRTPANNSCKTNNM